MSAEARTLVDDLVDVLVGVTEQAALAAYAHVGSGDKELVDQVAVEAMRDAFSVLPVSARIVVGEGEKDEAPMLYAGEELGSGGPRFDVAVDPIDGTRLAAENLPGAVAVMSIAPRDAFFDPGAIFYMEKLITTSAGRELSLERTLAENLILLAASLKRPVSSIRVAVQVRPRNQHFIDEAADAGAQVVTFADGDVVESVRAASGDGIDLLVGIGGAPEGVLVAAAVAALGGHMHARLAPQTTSERESADAARQPWGELLRRDDLVSDAGAFVLTAVTDAGALPGVHVDRGVSTTHSMLVTAGRGIRRIVTERADGNDVSRREIARVSVG